MKKILITLLLTAFSYGAWSAPVTHTSKIKSIDQQGDGQWVLTFDSDHASCTNGNAPNKYYYVTVGQEGVTEEGSKKLLSIALSAAIAKKTVHVVFNDDTSGCYINRIIVNFDSED